MIDLFSDDANADLSKGEKARRAILFAGMEVFADAGLEGARTRRIAELSGRNIAALHYYFGGKEDLYRAILSAVGRSLGGRLEPHFRELDRVCAEVSPPKRTLRIELRGMFLTLLEAGVANERTLSASRIVLREQLHPSPAFDEVYEPFFRPLHETVTRALAILGGGDAADPFWIARAQGVIGQLLIFRMGREMLLRRTGWKHIGPEEGAVIRRAVERNLKAVLR